MSPPGRAAASDNRARGGEHKSHPGGRPNNTLPEPSPTLEYLERRDRTGRFTLSRRPEEAAEQLATALGGRVHAWRWAKALLEATS
jgi:hypothetical protein